jgi:nicotinamidase-related amidase
MKKIIYLVFISIFSLMNLKGQNQKTALLIIDIQDFYFPGGKSALVEPEKAALNAAKLLDYFRKERMLVVHVRHNSETGGKINDIVKPLADEKIFSKDEVNCFKETELLPFLKANKIDTLIICGMQTHMCVEAATRAAADLGFKCTLIHDACATKDLKFGDKITKAEDVHNSTLATLKSYSKVVSTEEFLKNR